MNHRQRSNVPYFLTRRLRRTLSTLPAAPKPRTRLRYILEISGFIVAVAAATVAYFELRTLRDERLTPYRAVVFTTQLDSYRELTRLRDKFQWLSAYNGGTRLANVHTRARMGEQTAMGRSNFLCLAFEGRAGIGDQTLDADISDLLVALVSADAVWPGDLGRDLSDVGESLNAVRFHWSWLRSGLQRDQEGQDFRICMQRRLELGRAYDALDTKLGNLLQRMRRDLRVDQISKLPPA